MYAALVRALLASSVEVHYLSHITGHGLLKLMRPRRELTYTVARLPEVPEVLEFLVEQTEMSPAAAYSTFNMGCGFAVYCARGSGEEVVRIAVRARALGERGGRRRGGPAPGRARWDRRRVRERRPGPDAAPRRLADRPLRGAAATASAGGARTSSGEARKGVSGVTRWCTGGGGSM